MMCAVAVRLVTLLEVAGLKYQIPFFHAHPDMLARISISPFQNETALVLIEASLTIEIIAIKHMQDFTHPAGLDDLCHLWFHVRRCLLREIFLWDIKLTRAMLLLANHLLDHLPLFFRQPVALPQYSPFVLSLFWRFAICILIILFFFGFFFSIFFST